MNLYHKCSHTLTVTASPSQPGATVTADIVDLSGAVVMAEQTLPEVSSGVWQISVPSTLPTRAGQKLDLRVTGVNGSERSYMESRITVLQARG